VKTKTVTPRKPAPKRKAFRRWSTDSGGWLCIDGEWPTIRELRAAVAVLNAARVTLPRGRR
jgi:hypothetical protein